MPTAGTVLLLFFAVRLGGAGAEGRTWAFPLRENDELVAWITPPDTADVL